MILCNWEKLNSLCEVILSGARTWEHLGKQPRRKDSDEVKEEQSKLWGWAETDRAGLE